MSFGCGTDGWKDEVSEEAERFLFPHIEFRSFNGERHACIQGRLQLWQLIMVAQDYGISPENGEKIADHLNLKPEQVQAGIHYYETYPDEIDHALEENDRGYERLKAMLPNLEIASVSLRDLEASHH